MLVPAGWELSRLRERRRRARTCSSGRPRASTCGSRPRRRSAPRSSTPKSLRRVATGFLVEGLKVLTLKDMAAARRLLAPGGGPGLRFETLDSADERARALAYQQGAAHGVRAPRRARRSTAAAISPSRGRSCRASPSPGSIARPAPIRVRVAGRGASRAASRSPGPSSTPSPPTAAYRPESSLFIALLPDGTAGVVDEPERQDRGPARARIAIEGDQVTIEGPGLGRMTWRLVRGRRGPPRRSARRRPVPRPPGGDAIGRSDFHALSGLWLTVREVFFLPRRNAELRGERSRSSAALREPPR